MNRIILKNRQIILKIKIKKSKNKSFNFNENTLKNIG